MNSGSTPAPPDPAATAAAQASQNKETAITQAGLNMTNQVTPNGQLTYSQIGQWDDGTPRYQATTTLSPDQQALYGLNNQTQQNLGQIGVEQSAKIGDLLGQPVNLNNEATESRLMQLGTQRLSPLLQQRRDAEKTSLFNSGVRPGTEAYDRAMTSVTQGENDAYNQLLLTGRGQATQEALAERNAPINEISALLSGSQVSQPNFLGTQQSNVAPTDYTGAVNTAYGGQLAGAQAKNSASSANTGAIAGLAGSAALAAATF